MFHDRIGIGSKRKLADGRLVVDAKFARAGIYVYSGAEVDPDNEHGLRDRAEVRVYRPPAAVFDQASMASFAHKAVTDDHPSEMVTALNWSDLAKGVTDGHVARDGEFVRVPMMLTDAGLVGKVDEGKAELSAGYDAELDFALGFTPRGEAYDAQMTNIRGNHIAVVDKGRAGAECRIADADFEGVDDMTLATKAFLFDGISIMVTDQAEQAILKLQAQLVDSKTALESATSAHAIAIAAKDTELGTRDAEIVDLKGKVLDDAALDTLVTERAAALADVAKVADGIDTKGKSLADIRREAVIKALGDGGDAKVKDKSDDYVAALFDAFAAKGREDGGNAVDSTLADAIGNSLPGGACGGAPTSGEKAYEASRAQMRDAWKGEQPAGNA